MRLDCENKIQFMADSCQQNNNITNIRYALCSARFLWGIILAF